MVALVQGTTPGFLTSVGTAYLGTAPTSGNLLVLGVWDHETALSPSGWGTVAGTAYSFKFRTHNIGVFYKTAGTAEGTAFPLFGSGSVAGALRYHISEWSGAGSLDAYAYTTGIGSVPSGTVFPTGSGTALYYGFAVSNNGNTPSDTAIAAGTIAGAAGTALANGTVDSGALGIQYRYGAVSGTAVFTAATTIGFDYSGVDSAWKTINVVFAGSATPSAPGSAGVIIPAPGQDSLTTGTALTPYISSWRITRGASAEITGGAQPGFATLIVNNPTDDRFNPEGTASALYGHLVDGLPIWIGVNSDGRATGTAVRGLFGGRVKDVTPLVASTGLGRVAQVEITAEDALGWMGRTPVRLAQSQSRSHHQLREQVLSEAGEQRVDLAPEIDTMPLSGADGYALSILEELNRATGTRHFAKPGTAAEDWYTYVSRERMHNLAGTASTSLGTAQHVTRMDGWRKSADTVINRQKVSVVPITFTPYQVTVWQSESIPFGLVGSKEFLVDFDDYVSGPTVDVNYTGSTVTATLTPFGDAAKVTLTSAGTSTVTSLSIEGSLARRWPTQSYEANNTTSQAQPRDIREGSEISGDYVGTLASAQGLAEHVVWRYGSAQVRPTLTVENWFPTMFDLDLYDLVKFSTPQLGVTDRLFEIVGLTHEGNHAGTDAIHHRVTYVLQECRVQSATGWFIADTSTANGTAVLGY